MGPALKRGLPEGLQAWDPIPAHPSILAESGGEREAQPPRLPAALDPRGGAAGHEGCHGIWGSDTVCPFLFPIPAFLGQNVLWSLGSGSQKQIPGVRVRSLASQWEGRREGREEREGGKERWRKGKVTWGDLPGPGSSLEGRSPSRAGRPPLSPCGRPILQDPASSDQGWCQQDLSRRPLWAQARGCRVYPSIACSLPLRLRLLKAAGTSLSPLNSGSTCRHSAHPQGLSMEEQMAAQPV